jgi:hypothetical protein
MTTFNYGPRKVTTNIATATSTDELRSAIASSTGLPMGNSFASSEKILRTIDLILNGVEVFHKIPKTSGLNLKLLDLLLTECTTRSKLNVIDKQMHAVSIREFYLEDEIMHIYSALMQKNGNYTRCIHHNTKKPSAAYTWADSFSFLFKVFLYIFH